MARKTSSSKWRLRRNMAERIHYIQTGECSSGLSKILKKYPMDAQCAEVNESSEEPAESITDLNAPANINSLPLEVILMILENLEPKDSGACSQEYEKDMKNFWRLRGVNKKFRMALDCEYARRFPRPKVGVRISPKLSIKHPEDEDMVIVHIHGAKGNKYAAQCVHINNLKAAIWPCTVFSHFVVFGFRITEKLLNYLLDINLTQVKDFRFHDIRGIDLPPETATNTLKNFASQLKEANAIQFLMGPDHIEAQKYLNFDLPLMEREEQQYSVDDLQKEYNWKRSGLSLKFVSFQISEWISDLAV